MVQLFHRKASLFFLGLFLGLLIGGGIVLFLISKPSEHIQLSAEHFPPLLDALDSIKQERIEAQPMASAEMDTLKPDTLNYTDTVDQTLPDSLEVLNYLENLDAYWDTAYWEEDSLDDYRVLEQEPDSIARQFRRNVPEDIRTVSESPEVLSDVLLYRTQIPVLEEVQDSLGVPIIQEAPESPLDVSFWKSPLNYKGYRKGGRSLVLFGVYAVDSVRFFRSGPHLYMDVMDERFLITETFEYKHLIELSRKKNRLP